ncbi:hypothetical protein CCM_00928 [Cordyceps militaris CM01]|uniref:Uncharacterized protein n=1 Tax=Cordyceps militaris (strain CM01) TaxID=983644 RepID=G3J7A2_CORMM|nr:uncharacterized protein CCM_00928 [Cordyceps militaris CM01]EGX96272.1 hypothetical protein CCM_00928 [Cordyceps militaris CM01]
MSNFIITYQKGAVTSRHQFSPLYLQKLQKCILIAAGLHGRHRPTYSVKKRHYSYECQATAQERPYVSRPSRTQQLRNPKLVPKLTNDAPNPLEKKYVVWRGAADEELAKKEAERERRRALEDDDEGLDEPPRRPRSPSVESVSTVSTNSRGGSASPPRRRQDRHSSENVEEAGEIAESPPRRQLSRSPSPRRSREEHTDRRRVSPRGSDRRRREEYRRRSRSPRERRDREERRGHGDHRGRGDNRERQNAAPKSPPRERSLSPFSQRVAMTRSMQR